MGQRPNPDTVRRARALFFKNPKQGIVSVQRELRAGSKVMLARLKKEVIEEIKLNKAEARDAKRDAKQKAAQEYRDSLEKAALEAKPIVPEVVNTGIPITPAQPEMTIKVQSVGIPNGIGNGKEASQWVRDSIIRYLPDIASATPGERIERGVMIVEAMMRYLDEGVRMTAQGPFGPVDMSDGARLQLMMSGYGNLANSYEKWLKVQERMGDLVPKYMLGHLVEDVKKAVKLQAIHQKVEDVPKFVDGTMVRLKKFQTMRGVNKLGRTNA